MHSIRPKKKLAINHLVVLVCRESKYVGMTLQQVSQPVMAFQQIQRIFFSQMERVLG
jgi:hypothetical protein